MRSRRNIVVTILVEALLIFGSVYGAFLLEDRRSRAFERSRLVDKLEKLLISIEYDSILLSQDFSAGTENKQKLTETLHHHEVAKTLIKKGDRTSLDSVYSLHKNGYLYFRLFRKKYEPDHSIVSIIDNFEEYIINDSTLYYLTAYDYDTWLIHGMVGNADDVMDEVNNFAAKNYFVLSSFEKEKGYYGIHFPSLLLQ